MATACTCTSTGILLREVGRRAAINEGQRKLLKSAQNLQRQRIQYRHLSSSAASSSSPPSSSLDVAIFIDLDNVAPSTLSRADVHALTDPLRQFAKAAGELREFRAFANKNTQLHFSDEERARLSERYQVYIEWDGETCQSGFDEEGHLRCGVCGSTVARSREGSDREEAFKKLGKHMRMQHDREQEKRQTRINMLKNKRSGRKVPGRAKLIEKEWEKHRKYEAAQVGLKRRPAARVKKNKSAPLTNDLFPLLQGQGIKCSPADDVDDALIKAAQKWISGSKHRHKSEGLNARGCLVVVSEDGDFGELLRRQEKDIITVTATPKSTAQTESLVNASDIALTLDDMEAEIDDTVEGVFGSLIAKPITLKGVQLLEQMEERSFSVGSSELVNDDTFQFSAETTAKNKEDDGSGGRNDAVRLMNFLNKSRAEEDLLTVTHSSNLLEKLSESAKAAVREHLTALDRPKLRPKERKKIERDLGILCSLWTRGVALGLDDMPWGDRKLVLCIHNAEMKAAGRPIVDVSLSQVGMKLSETRRTYVKNLTEDGLKVNLAAFGVRLPDNASIAAMRKRLVREIGKEEFMVESERLRAALSERGDSKTFIGVGERELTKRLISKVLGAPPSIQAENK